MPDSSANSLKSDVLFPIFLNLSGKAVLVVGGGAVAKRKIEALLDTGAQIWVGAPELDAQIEQWREIGKLQHLQGEFVAEWLDAKWLVIAATDDRAVNIAVSQQAQARQIWVNVVDDAPISSFQTPARIQRGPLQIAISSGGAAPMLARHLRETLETQFDPAYGTLAELFEDCRAEIRVALPELPRRRAFFEAVLHGEILHLLRSGNVLRARHELRQTLNAEKKLARSGRVALVGAGPGDAGLLTLRALRVLNLADVILSDQLVSPAVLALARRDAEVIFVGKRGGGHCTAQEHIHELMREHASAGKFVVRLKGGDPFVFGRGGEELEYLAAQHIAFEVVPGITAAVACAAYSGVPLTHRDLAQSVRFVTAHCKASLDTLDWQALAQERQTLAVYMGVSALENLQNQLLQHGRAGKTPVAIIENGTRSNQRVLVGKLSTLAQLAKLANAQSPSLLLIGEVAQLATSLHWFGEKPKSLADYSPQRQAIAA